MSSKSRRQPFNVTEFETFFNGWLVRQEEYLQELHSALQTRETLVNNDVLRDLITRVLAHYQEYYDQKSRIANYNVSLVFSPPWFSPFERSFFWIAGFKPALAFRIVNSSVDDMDGDQIERMERLTAETKAKERELENEMARVQESVAAPPIVEVVKRIGCNIDGMYDDMARATEGLRGEMEVVLANADMLRSRTAERVVEILFPVQKVKFLAAVAELQLKIRMWGWQIDGDKRR